MFATVRILSDSGLVRVELARWRDRLVVVKRLKSHSPFLRARIQREAEVLRKLEHENIVPVLSAEDDAVVYAYCPGVSLAEALEAGPVPMYRCIKIISDVLRALEYSHQNKIIHCDVKPGNILVRGEKALLADFGFAKDLALTAITEQDVFLGTPNYMAPEQFRGDRSDPRSDIYSAGAVLYHMLSGAPPFGGQVIRFLVGDPNVHLEPLADEFAELNAIVSKALSRLPEARFQAAQEMLESIEKVLVAA